MNDGSGAATLSEARGPPHVTTARMARVARLPATWLVVLVGGSTLVRASISLGVPSPWILPDEIVYSELAKSIAQGTRPSIRGIPVFGWGEVYPTLIAPAWLFFDDLVAAHHAALAINSLVMSTAAIPAYLLARLFVAPKPSFLVAVMTVLVPSMTLTSVVMTENACYPAFLWALYAMTRAVGEPSLRNQALVLAALFLLVLTRVQGVALVAAYLGSIVLFAALARRTTRVPYLRRFAPTVAVLVPLCLAPVLLSLLRGDGMFGWLGVRSATFAEFRPGEIPRWFVYLSAGLVLYVAVAPAAAAAVMTGRGLSRRASHRARLYTAMTLPSIVAIVGSVSLVSASLDVDGVENLNERYVFYVVPLLFLALVLWVSEGMPRPRPWAALVVLGCMTLAVLLPIGRLSYNAGFQAASLEPWIAASLSRPGLTVLVGVFAGLCGGIWLASQEKRVRAVWVVVGLWMPIAGLTTVNRNSETAAYFARSFAGLVPSWVDRAVPAGTRVPVIWHQGRATASPDQLYFRLAVTEFFNESLGTVHSLGGRTYYDGFLPSVPASSLPDGTIRDSRGRPLSADYVLATCRSPVAGSVVAESPGGELILVEVRGAVRLSSARSCAGASS